MGCVHCQDRVSKIVSKMTGEIFIYVHITTKYVCSWINVFIKLIIYKTYKQLGINYSYANSLAAAYRLPSSLIALKKKLEPYCLFLVVIIDVMYSNFISIKRRIITYLFLTKINGIWQALKNTQLMWRTSRSWHEVTSNHVWFLIISPLKLSPKTPNVFFDH